jgi:hypothetical protein
MKTMDPKQISFFEAETEAKRGCCVAPTSLYPDIEFRKTDGAWEVRYYDEDISYFGPWLTGMIPDPAKQMKWQITSEPKL